MVNTTDVSPVTNPSQCRKEPWDMVSSLPSASAHVKESRAKTVSEPASELVAGERRDNESRESPVNSRAPTEIVDGQESRRKG
jgi:hypothetical protein